ncbi:Ldh family oxidoreductase [Virgibacillus oceani]
MTLLSRYDWKELRDFCIKLFKKRGVNDENASIIADALIEADLRGVYSHGIVRTAIYLKRIEEGMVDPSSCIEIINDNEITTLIDGNNNLGAVVGKQALNLALKKSDKKGAAIVGVKGSNHFGTGAFYAAKSISQDKILLVMSNASQTMPPTGGIRPFIGTNPLSIGVPTDKEIPFILDMATSVVARGKIIVASQKNEEIPLGWAVDRHGKPTTDPNEALEGSVLPMGGPKGYAISMMIDILSGVLTGAGFGKHINNMYENWGQPQNVGHFFIVIDIKQFIPIEEFKQRMDQYIRDIKSEPKAEGVKEILIPGEIEYKKSEEQKKYGIELPDSVVEELKDLSQKYGVEFVSKKVTSSIK